MALNEESAEKRKSARLVIFELANMISVPMSLNAIVRLKVADAIWQGGSNAPLSASQILQRIASTGSDPENLQRILRMLTSYGVFEEHLTIESSPLDGSASERKYSLTEVGKTLVTDTEGLSYAPYVLQHHQDALMKAWPLVHEAVLDPTTEPFVKANGEPAYDYYGKQPEMNELMLKAMSGVSVPFMEAMLDGYDGFKGVERLVDVGGSAGDCLRMILKKHPGVRQGINFDLPEVVAKAPIIPGVTNVGGDMFKSIPDGDAIFMKWILTTWTDNECKLIMENCYKALPVGGKLIACEPVLPEDSDDSHRTRALLEGDIFVMTIYRAKGKHRTEEEFKQLAMQRHLGGYQEAAAATGTYGIMASDREDFSLSGPLHLAIVDWTNAHHRRSVAASLVQGVYILERDRQLKRQGPQALASPWWEFFHFQLLRHLVDDVDSSIFAAIYEFKPPKSHYHNSVDESPRYVIAFRGTITKPESVSRDLQLDLHILRNGLHETSRFEIAIQAVRNVVATVGESNVWLAGHSLGAAMALLAGKTMAKTGFFLQAFLFNSPFFSAPIERIKDERVKHGLRIANSVITAGLAFATKKSYHNNRSVDPFAALSEWIPFLFVNPGDHLCSEYIGYLEHRKKMDDIGIGAIERLATQNSLGGLLMSAMGRESEPLHLIPSANLIVNLTPCQDFREAHGIHQWWRPDLDIKSKLYNYK